MHAILSLQSTSDLFTKNGCNICMANLDLNKAFDKVSHFKLYLSLINAGIPIVIIKDL